MILAICFFLLISTFDNPVFAQTGVVHHILVTGQSLAHGANGEPVLTTTQPFSNIMLDRAHPFHETKNIGTTSFVPLVERKEESISSALANYVTAQIPGNEYQIEINTDGWAGHGYDTIRKGTMAFAVHEDEIRRSQELARHLGKAYRVPAVTTIHGETDDMIHRNILTSPETCDFYEKYLLEWQRDYEQMARDITKQSEPVPLFTDQVSSFSLWSTYPCVALAQLAAAEGNPETIVLVGPKYFLHYSEGPHLTSESYRWLGEYYGKVYKQVVVDGKPWRPLSPRDITRSGNVITLRLHVPVSPLIFDTDRVSAQPQYGFEYVDDSGKAPAITQVQIVSADTVEITLAAVPQGKSERLRYAYSAVKGSDPGATSSGAPRGNVRDSDKGASLHGNDLYNWLVHFDKPIGGEENPSFWFRLIHWLESRLLPVKVL